MSSALAGIGIRCGCGAEMVVVARTEFSSRLRCDGCGLSIAADWGDRPAISTRRPAALGARLVATTLECMIGAAGMGLMALAVAGWFDRWSAGVCLLREVGYPGLF